MLSSFPIYILQLDDELVILVTSGRVNIQHIDWWEQTVAWIVAKHYKLPINEVLELPYSQRRGRVCGNTVYYGEKQDPVLLGLIRCALGNDDLVFVHSDHQSRSSGEALQFEYLVQRWSPEQDAWEKLDDPATACVNDLPPRDPESLFDAIEDRIFNMKREQNDRL